MTKINSTTRHAILFINAILSVIFILSSCIHSNSGMSHLGLELREETIIHINCQYGYTSHLGLELREETINGFKVKFLIPSDYTKDLREERSQMAFYSDKTMMMDESSLIYFSQKEPRSYFTIVSCNIEDDPYRYSDYMKGGEIYMDSIMTITQLLTDKGWTYRMPLLQKKKDIYGHPITTIQYITRYKESDTIWGIPIIKECEFEKDSIEAICDFTIVIGTNCIECYFYSLDSYDNFSYERFLKIISSITVTG